MRLAPALAVVAAGVAMTLPATAGATSPRADASIANGRPSNVEPAVVHVVVGTREGGASLCGGTLVAARFVVTAAHCVRDKYGAVSAGQVAVAEGPSHAGPFTLVHPVAAVESHPSYGSAGRMTFDHDIAVITLAAAAAQEPIPLLAADQLGAASPGAGAVALGWGITETGAVSQTLLSAGVTLLGDDVCVATLQSLAPGLFQPETMICAETGVQDTCTGDSGGPLLVRVGAHQALAGATSWGGYGCPSPGIPSVFADLAGELGTWVRARVPQASFAIAPAVVRPGAPVRLTSTSANPGMAYTAFAWDLDGDGRFDDATGPDATARLSAGTTTVGLQATSPAGDREVARRDVTVAAGPPDVRALRLSRTRFGARRGTTVRFRLSRPAAAVTIVVARRVRGHRSDGRCRPPRAAGPAGPPCRLDRSVASLTRRTHGRRGRIGLGRRIGGARLRPGDHRLTLTARTADGRRGRSRSVRFVVLRR